MIGQAIRAKNIDGNTKKQKRPPNHQKSNVCLWITFNFWWPARLVNGLKICHPSPAQKWNVHFWITFNFWWSVEQSKQKHWPKCKKKKQKWPPKSFKNQRFVFGLHSTSDDWPSDLSKKCWLKCKKNKKGPLSHWKIKGLFLDYIQLLMISRAIQIKNVNRNYKKPRRPSKSLKNQMFIFGLHSTSDEQLSDLSEKHWLKCKKIKKAP